MPDPKARHPRRHLLRRAALGVALASLLALVCYLFYDARVTRELEVELERVRADGGPFDLEDWEPPPPPEGVNAAAMYRDAARKLVQTPEYPRLDDFRLANFPMRGEAPFGWNDPLDQLGDFVEVNWETSELLRRATKEPIYHVPVDPAQDRYCASEDLATGLGYLEFEVSFFARTGRAVEALTSLDALFACADRVESLPQFWSSNPRNRLAHLSKGCRLVQHLTSSGVWPAEEARGWIERLAHVQTAEPFIPALRHQRAESIDWMLKFDRRIEGEHQFGHLRHTRVPLLRTFPAFRRADLACYLRALTPVLGFFARPFPEIEADLLRAEEDAHSAPFPSMWSPIMFPSLHWDRWEAADVETRVTLARTAIALIAHRSERGHWPESLGELVPDFLQGIPIDAITGNPVLYRIEEGHALLSIDREGTREVPAWRDDVGSAEWILK